LKLKMGNTVIREFHYSYTDEPHASRRKEMLSKYPKIKELYGLDTSTKYYTFAWVASQYLMAYCVRNDSWWTVFLVAYLYGAVANHALFLAIHEISHNLAFPKPWQNKCLGVFANLSTGFPHFSMFQRYHMEHHQYQGVEGIDTDVPSTFEGLYITNAISKLLFVIFMPLVYVFRPLLIKPKEPGFWEAVNWIAVFAMDALVYYYWGPRACAYFILSSLLGSGLHPIVGHFIAEHYIFLKGQETYSYYGPLNSVVFNVGYHNEHHDFPRIPGSKLPVLRKIAPEYYDQLGCHASWSRVIYEFITDPTVSPFSRVIRKNTRVTKDD